MNEQNTESGFVRYLTLADLQGSLTKTLVIPTGYQGVSLETSGKVFPAGTHKVITLRQRLFGKASDWRFALLPATPFVLRVPIPRLQAGDGTWVDINALLLLHVEDALRAATACPGMMTELAAGLSAALEAPARQAVTGWAAADLGRQEVNARLAAELRPLLEAHVTTLGLKVERLLAVSAQPSAETLAAAQQRDALEMERQMDALATRAEWLDFVRTFQADFGLTPAALDALLADVEEGEFSAARLRQAIRATLASEEAALTVRTERILGAFQPPVPPPPAWWEAAIPWLKLGAGLLLFAGLAFFAVSPFLGSLGQSALIVLLVMVLLAVALFAIGLWLEPRAAARHRIAVAPQSLLERLGRGDRQRMDRLVREQVARELAALRDKINDARTHAYRDGRREEALRLKPVEDRADTLRATAEAQGYGPVAYLTEAHITHQQLATMLDYDEELLARAAAVGDLAEEMRQTVLAEDNVAPATARLETALSALDHQFQARARFIQS